MRRGYQGHHHTLLCGYFGVRVGWRVCKTIHPLLDNNGEPWNASGKGLRFDRDWDCPSRLRQKPKKGSALGTSSWEYRFATVAIGLALTLTGGSYFWPGIWLAYVGTAIALLDLWVIGRSLHSRSAKILGTIGLGALSIISVHPGTS